MENKNWLKLVIAGVFLAAVAVGYFIYSQSAAVSPGGNGRQAPVSQVSPTPSVLGENVNDQTKGGLSQTEIDTLPKTAVPTYFIGVFSLSAAVAGYFLRKFPQ